MKRIRATLLVLMLLLSPHFFITASALAPVDLKSGTAVLMDLDTGQVLYDKGMARKMYPASTTKILTALVVLENCRPSDMITVTESAIKDIKDDHSHISLAPGERITVDSALYALMLPSANDSANVLAEHVAGSLEEFARMMTAKAHEIGAINSNFTNAHGYHDDNHYTTAYDIALITRYAMQNDLFRIYFGTDRYTMPATNLKVERPFTNYQYMLVRDTGYYNADVVGGKVGFTDEAQHTMSTVATRGERSLVCVVMRSAVKGDKFSDTEKLLNFGFEEFIPLSVSRDSFSGLEIPVKDEGRTVGSAMFTYCKDFTALVHSTMDPSRVNFRYDRPETLEKKGPIACSVVFEQPDSPDFVPSTLGVVPLDVELSFPFIPEIAPQDTWKEDMTAKILPFLVVILGAVGLFMIFLLYRRHQIRKRRRKRQERLDRRMREPLPSASAVYRQAPVSAAGHQGAAYSSSFPGSSGSSQKSSGYSTARPMALSTIKNKSGLRLR